ncbi:hypothetical protein [Corallibacter sp.]|uniref:hypothetical protein n=1 Tax=Corallibacter sp. TaxID=2038084 RepID=UPI003AB1B545
MNSLEILENLRTSEPQLLTDLPETFGIYALWDHEKKIRYIGCTPKATEGFRKRVGSKHVTGSEGRSHKFSQAYCTGRMWRYCKKLDPSAALNAQDPNDAKLAKRLRTLFIRKHCRVTFVEISAEKRAGNYFSFLTSLESEVLALAPSSMRLWEKIGFSSLKEPIVLVDELLEENPKLKDAAERQALIYRKYIEHKESEIA